MNNTVSSIREVGHGGTTGSTAPDPVEWLQAAYKGRKWRFRGDITQLGQRVRVMEGAPGGENTLESPRDGYHGLPVPKALQVEFVGWLRTHGYAERRFFLYLKRFGEVMPHLEGNQILDSAEIERIALGRKAGIEQIRTVMNFLRYRGGAKAAKPPEAAPQRLLLKDVYSLFLAHQRRRGLRKKSLAAILWDIKPFLSFLKGRGIEFIDEVKRMHLGEYREDVFSVQRTPHGKPLAMVTQARRLQCVGHVFRILLRNEAIKKNPVPLDYFIRPITLLSKNNLSREEISRLLDSVPIGTVMDFRNRVILECFYAAGLRINEVCNIRLKDINQEDGLLRVHEGKGGVERIVPITRTLAEFLEYYLAKVRARILNPGLDSQVLFPTTVGTAIGPKHIGFYLTRYLRAAGIEKRVSSHVFRHSISTHLMESGADVRHIQKLLGHGSIATTQGYLRTTTSDLRRAVLAYHPRERKYIPSQTNKEHHEIDHDNTPCE